jgi:hypothetical protein
MSTGSYSAASAASSSTCLICYRCEKAFVSTGALERHLQTVHDFHLQSCTIEFSSEESFLEWKSRVESTCCHPQHLSYVVYRGSRQKTDGSVTRYFICSLSSLYRKRRKDPSARFYCPSRITAEKRANGTISVHYVSTHIPHSHFNNPNAMQCRLELRAKLAQLTALVENIESQNQLHEMNDSLALLIKRVTTNSTANEGLDIFDEPLELGHSPESAATTSSLELLEEPAEISIEQFMNICALDKLFSIHQQ